MKFGELCDQNRYTFLLIVCALYFFVNGSLTVFAVGSPEAPEFVGGADSGGETNSGTGITAFANSAKNRLLTKQGNYLYVLSVGNAGACSQTAGATNGCELKVFDVSTPSTPTYVGGADASGGTNTVRVVALLIVFLFQETMLI